MKGEQTMRMPNGKEFQTTFWEDFSIADVFGDDAIRDTYKRAFEEWKEDLVYLTELVIVLNMKCWQWYESNDKRSALYSDLYYQTNDYAWDFVGDDEEKADYYFEMTD